MTSTNTELRSQLYTDPDLAVRPFDEESPRYRDHFSRDRDRILYSKEFRRLAGKTQVFVSGFDDHFRTRLTHTLEVSQIARTVSRALGFNELLTEAIALGHDVGHTPFGHAGERWLNLIMSGCYRLRGYESLFESAVSDGGFRHNWQGVRAVRRLEEVSEDYQGLNLTWQTVWGILHHTKVFWKNCPHYCTGSCTLFQRNSDCHHGEPPKEIEFYRSDLPEGGLERFDDYWTPEALVVRMADEIAQRHHDIEDGISAGILDPAETIEFIYTTFENFLTGRKRRLKNAKKMDENLIVPEISRLVVDLLTSRLIEDTKNRLSILTLESDRLANIEERQAVWAEHGFDLVGFSDEFESAESILHNHLKKSVLGSHMAQTMDGKAGYVIRQLFKAFVTNPEQLPDRTVSLLYWRLNEQTDSSGNLSIFRGTPAGIGHCREWLRETHTKLDDGQYRKMLVRTICDFIAGMTDAYAMKQFDLLYGTQTQSRAVLG